MNTLPSEDAAVVATIDPDSNGVATHTSDYVDMGKFGKLMAIVQLGILGVAATVDAKLVQATDAAGTGKKDITGKALAQLVKATDDDKQGIINLRDEELDVNGGFAFVAIEMAVGAAASQSSAVLLGMQPRYAPASESDLASVAEIV